VTLAVDPDRIYLFDAARGDALAGARRDEGAAIDAAAPPVAPAPGRVSAVRASRSMRRSASGHINCEIGKHLAYTA
jgi:hypothetical protein